MNHEQQGLPQAYSLYLDVLRFAAAVAVFLNHIGKYPFMPRVTKGTPLGPLEVYGAPAVTIFFVLSGYVIAYVVDTRERDARSYTISRLSRLYSVVVPAIILTFVLDRWGSAIDPALYAERVVSPEPMTLGGYFASFLLINEFQVFGFHGIAPGSNGPWWSLSFEAAYYLVAGVLLFLPRKLGLVAALIILALGGRTIAALFPIWALGYGLYRWRVPLAARLPAPGFWLIASTVALAAIPWLLPKTPDMNFGFHFPWAQAELNRNLAQDYATAAAVALHLVAAYSLLRRAQWPSVTDPVVRFLGAMTFPLYAMHRPVMFFVAAVSPWSPQSAAGIVLTVAVVFLGAALVTGPCDRLKTWLRDQLRRTWPAPQPPAKAA